MPDEKPANYYQNIRPEMLDFIPAEARTVLDVGCGEGYFAQQLKQSRDVEVWGIEMVEARARVAVDRLDTLLVGDVATLIPHLPASRFDALVFNDVLEHLLDPFDVLARIKACLTPQGVVVSFWIANALANRRFLDMQFVKFATVARPLRTADVSATNQAVASKMT